MTPTLPELLAGTMAAIADPPPPESAGDFMAGKIGLIGMISLLAAQEAEHGVQARVEENKAIRAVLGDAVSECDERMGGRLKALAGGRDAVLTLRALDAENAALRRALIDLHALADAEPGAGRALRRDIVRLYKFMADGRALHLPGAPPPS